MVVFSLYEMYMQAEGWKTWTSKTLLIWTVRLCTMTKHFSLNPARIAILLRHHIHRRNLNSSLHLLDSQRHQAGLLRDYST